MLTAATAPKTVLKATRQLLGASADGSSGTPFTLNDVMGVGTTDKLGQVETSGTDSIAIGLNTKANADGAVAIGSNVSSTASNSVAIGSSVISNGANATAIGVQASVVADRGLAVGYYADAETTDSIALGTSAGVGGAGTSGIAIGLKSLVTGANSVVLGNNSSVAGTNTIALGNNIVGTKAGTGAAGNNSVILGFGSDGSQSNVVSIGSAGNERKIVNVAAGTTTTDAVNYGQLQSVQALIGSGGTGGTGGTSLVTQDSTSKDILVASTVDGTHVNFANSSGAARELINVGNGTTQTSAVNLSQLKPVVDALGGGAKVDSTTGAVTAPTYSIQGANKATVGDALTSLDTGLSAANTKIAALDAGGSSLVTQATTTSDLLVGSAVGGTHVNFAATGGVARELTGVAAGKTPTSAVNLSQLTPVVTALGGGAAVNTTTGAVTGPTYTILGKPSNNAGDAFKDVDDGLADLKGSIAAISADTGGAGLVAQNATTGDITVGKLTGGTVVDLTNTSGVQRTLTGVANGNVGSSSFDAINGSQLYSASRDLATAIGGGAAVSDDGKGTITQPSFSVAGKTVHNVGDAINSLDTQAISMQTQITNIAGSGGGVATPNAVAYDTAAHDQLTLASTSGGTTKISGVTAGDISSATSTDAVTGGQLYATNQDVAALQTSVQNIASTGTSGIGINGINGTNGTNGADGTSAPTAASATGSDAIAMGDNASASGDHAVVIGGGASGTADGTIAIGGNAGASGKDSIAIGNGATAPATNAVALGANSVADRDNTVSMGSDGSERQVTNVAAGTRGTDAVNLNQMNSALGGVARKAYSGIAAATALTMIPDVDANKTLSIGIGGGTFQGYAATAIGGTARITQNIKVRVGAGWSAAGTTVGAGASYQW